MKKLTTLAELKQQLDPSVVANAERHFQEELTQRQRREGIKSRAALVMMIGMSAGKVFILLSAVLLSVGINAVIFNRHGTTNNPETAQTDTQFYCEMRQTYRDTGGHYGWPAFDLLKEQRCKGDAK